MLLHSKFSAPLDSPLSEDHHGSREVRHSLNSPDPSSPPPNISTVLRNDFNEALLPSTPHLGIAAIALVDVVGNSTMALAMYHAGSGVCCLYLSFFLSPFIS
jgi:hypothetical protein